MRDKRQHARSYLIEVEGHLGPGWAEWFDGLTLTLVEDGPDGPTTLLRGVLPDSAALYGLLTKLQRLNLPLIRLERLPERSEDGDA